MFLLRKLVSGWLLPFPAALAAIWLGLFFSWFSARQRLGKGLIAAGACVLSFCGFGAMSALSLAPLERRFPPIAAPALSAESLRSATEAALGTTAGTGSGAASSPLPIVVLGAGYLADATLPANDRLGAAGLARLVEGVRLWRLDPRAELVLSNGLGQGPTMAEAARDLGVPGSRVTLEEMALDTEAEVRAIERIVRDRPFFLVTSAAHMRRAVALCRARALRPVPAPTDFLVDRGDVSALSFVPTTGNLVRTDRALHEWMGLLWSRLRGQL